MAQSQDGILIGNQLDKSQLTNPLARRMVAGFDVGLLRLIDHGGGGDTDAPAPRKPLNVHEVGCGEGRLSRKLRHHLGVPVRATDFSRELIAENVVSAEAGIEYVARSVYDLDPAEDAADLIVCCEVLEHVERPAEALAALARLRAPAYILSVPREPLWRVLNFVRGKYLGAWGNTPGHLNHWSRASFLKFLERGGFKVQRCLQPLPWTMVRGRFED